MYMFNYIVFPIVVVMSCNSVGDITCVKILFSMVIMISTNIETIIIIGYFVCIISVNGVMLINENIVVIIAICFLYIMCLIYIVAIKHIS